MTSSPPERVTRVYDRIARVYDLWNAPMEWVGLRGKRRRLFALARGATLEAGIGTGRNLEVYPDDVTLTGIDISAKMLDGGRRRTGRLDRRVELQQADVTALPFADGTFETSTAACLFCSVPDPVAGLRELARVTRADGRVLLLEHVRPTGRVAGPVADGLSPVTSRLFGPALNRRTEENARTAGLDLLAVRRDGIWREIVARPRPVETKEHS